MHIFMLLLFHQQGPSIPQKNPKIEKRVKYL